MRFNHTLSYDAAPHDVHAMLLDPAFRQKVCRAQRLDRCTVTVSPTATGTEVVVDQNRPTSGIPSFAHTFVGDEIRIVQTETWGGPNEAVLDVNIPGKPGHLKGSIVLAPSGVGTVETVSGELKVHVPLVGGKLEKLVGSLLESALNVEERVGKAWLAGER